MDNGADSSTSKFVPEYRRTNFKNKGRFSADELRRRRDTQQVELRKAKRDEALAKRRNFVPPTDGADSDEEDESSISADQQFYSQLQQELPQMTQQLNSDDMHEQLSATVKLSLIHI